MALFRRCHSKAHPKAPGMKYKHYAPKADLKIVEGREDEVIAAINRLVEQGNKAGEKVGVIATEETKGLYEGGIVKSIGPDLFGSLRHTENGPGHHEPPDEGGGPPGHQSWGEKG